MAATIRLNKDEQEQIRKKCIEINKLLVQREFAPIKDSELIHKLIAEGVKRLEVSRTGEVFLPD